jgi:uncharacterized protein (TIGR02145 family)
MKKQSIISLMVFISIVACDHDYTNPIDPQVETSSVILSAPRDSLATNNSTPTFQWLAVDGAEAYHLQVDDQPSFGSPAIDRDISGTSYADTTIFSDATWYWRLRPRFGEDGYKEWSEIRQFSVDTQGPSAPVLKGPETGQISDTPRPQLSWNAVVDAGMYELFVAFNDSAFNTVFYRDSTLTQSTFSFTTDLGGGVYYWRVRGRDASGNWGDWSEQSYFSVLQNVVLNIPSDNFLTNNPLIQFNWNDIEGASAYGLAIDDNPEFSNPEFERNDISGSEYILDQTLSDGTWYWRVQAQDATGSWDEWSSVRSFILDTQKPDMPSLISPDFGLVSDNHQPTLSWTSISDAVIYDLILSNIDSTFVTINYRDSTLSQNSHTIIQRLPSGIHYWKVRTKDKAGNWSHWSNTSLYSILDKVDLNSPKDKSITLNSRPVFSWVNVEAASGYILWVDNNSDFESPEIETQTQTTNYSPDQDLSSDIYFWKVQPLDERGIEGISSEIWSSKVIESGTVTDIDGNTYKTVKIGNQWWMAENLKVTHYRNGDPIPNITDNDEWPGLNSDAQCIYDNNVSNNVASYGRLYNWYAVNDPRGLAPDGWRVPSDDDWKQLEMYLGMSRSEADDAGWRGTDEGSKLAGNSALWEDGNLKNNDVFGESGFSALPGGSRFSYDGNFYRMGLYASFWSASESDNYSAWYRSLYYFSSDINRNLFNKNYGFSVRCLRD